MLGGGIEMIHEKKKMNGDREIGALTREWSNAPF